VAGELGAVGEGLFEIGLDKGDTGPLRRGYGGDVANVCVMAARAGIGARLAARVGADALGRALLAFWGAEGVDVGHVQIEAGAPTGIYVNERTPGNAHRFDYHRRGSAGSLLAPEDIAPAFISGLTVLHTSGISLAVVGAATAAAAERARAAGALISFAVNHRPNLDGDPEAILAAARGADVVFISAEEAELLLETSAIEEVRAALGHDPSELVVTLGANGAAIAAGSEVLTIRAPAVDAVDAAGAGDALAGAYLAARIRGLDPEPALRRGVAAAALSCRAFGCALSYPAGAEIEALAERLA
jgi:2-dehydro-3-deoxygluconokinase